ncbi:16422_t:CDS:2 [Rhizophagus irregularis]|nr:16422_t:CDS:2 [Rhizophagus irregularis]
MDINRQVFTKSQTYYEILEISDENVSIEQIKQQYQKLLLLVSFLNSLYQKHKVESIIKAWKVLRDPELKKVYDDELKAMRLKHEIYNADVDLDDMEYNEEMKLYSISCRCSGNYIITEQDLEKGANITGCTNCSLKIHILYEVNDE